MSRKILLMGGICLALLSAYAQTTQHVAEVFVTSLAKLDISGKEKGTSVNKASWMKDAADRNVTASKIAKSGEWTEMKFSVTPTADGPIDIVLRSNFARDENKKILDNQTVFKNLTVNGNPVGREELKFGVLATYAKKVGERVEGKAGQKLDISVSATVPDAWWGTAFLDLKPFANRGFAEQGTTLTPLKNFDPAKADFSGMKFRVVNPASNKGKSVVNVTGKNPLRLDLSKAHFAGRNYIYFLWTCGDNINFTDSACASMVVTFKDGSKKDFWIRKDREFGRSKDPAHVCGKALPAYVDDKKSNTGVLYFAQIALNSLTAVKEILLQGQDFYVFGITVSAKDVPSVVPHKFDMSQWRAVDMSNLEIADGSALDVADGIGEKQAGKFGRVKISDDGHFEFENRPGVPVKFKGTNWRPGDGFGGKIKTHEDIDELARMTRKQGYNLIRWRISMRKNEFEAPYKLKEFNKDLYDYFFYAFAREGVYAHFNLASHDLGNPSFKWDDRGDVKILMFFGEPSVRRDWRKLVHMELNLVNKYTGKKWKDDPSIATTEYFNEIELGPVALARASAPVKKFVNEKFRQYLKETYKDFGAWSETAAQIPNLKSMKSFDDVKASELASSQPDFARFMIKSGMQMREFCENVVRNEEGFKAPLHQHNCVRSTAFAAMSADAGSYTALNVYHNHPSKYMDKGSVVGANSSVGNFADYWRAAAAKRVAGRPLMLSEWQHCHWNPLKHEAGVLFPAYSSLQGFDNLTVHDVAIAKAPYPLGSFEVAASPVFRANEFLSYALFYRGDAKKSPNRVDVVYDKNYIEESNEIGNGINAEQSKIALLTGFALEFPSLNKISDLKNVKVREADIKMSPVGSSATWSAANFASTGAGDKKFDMSETAQTLREKGILPKENITDPKKGIFQSDTGEITMRAKEELVKVVTAKTEAVALKHATTNEKLGRATVISTSVPAAFAVVSVDDRPLSRSERMVLVYNTDDISTDFGVSTDRSTLISRGKLPILMQVGKLSAELKLPEGGDSFVKKITSLFDGEKKSYSLYSLKINGERAEKLPAEIKDGVMKIEIDTSKTKEISPFFEIVKE